MHQEPIKSLTVILSKHSGRNASGIVTAHHQGGRHKRYYRVIDFRRDKDGVKGRVVSIEYDPNRSSDIALIQYADGEKRYILAPLGLEAGQMVESGTAAEVKIGNSMPMGAMPVGTQVHNIELRPGSGGQMIRSAGGSAAVLAKDAGMVQLKLPSGEVRAFDANCRATVGQVSRVDWKNRFIGKAGRARHMGRRPTVRGVAQNPRSHPHGGGEGRSGIGMPGPKSPWGKPTLGKKTRKLRKYSDKFIIAKKKS